MSLVSGPTFYVGQIIEYSVSVSNLGPSDAYEVDLSFNLSGTSVSSYQTAQDCSGTTCSIDSIPNGGSVNIRLFVVKDGSANFDATATVNNITGYSVDPIVANNIDNTGNGGTVSAASDLQVTQTLLTSPPYAISDVLTYEIKIKNNGPANSTNVQLTNALQNMSAGGYSNCTSSTSVLCTVNGINVGVTRTITYTATVTGGNIANTASATATQYDPNLANNSALNSNNVATDSDLTTDISITPSAPYFSGQDVQFVILIKNTGPDTATNVVVDSLLTNLFITGGSPNCPFLPCTLPTLNSGGIAEIQLDGFIPGIGSFAHAINVYSDQNDANTGDNFGEATGTANPSADLQMQVSLLDSPPFYEGQVVHFEVIAKNNGPAPASNVTIGANLTRLQLLTASSTNCNTLPCAFAALEVGANNQEVISVAAQITEAGSFVLGNFVDATQYDDIQGNDSASAGGTASTFVFEIIFEDSFE